MRNGRISVAKKNREGRLFSDGGSVERGRYIDEGRGVEMEVGRRRGSMSGECQEVCGDGGGVANVWKYKAINESKLYEIYRNINNNVNEERSNVKYMRKRNRKNRNEAEKYEMGEICQYKQWLRGSILRLRGRLAKSQLK